MSPFSPPVLPLELGLTPTSDYTLLLDAHTFLWFIDGNAKLGTTARDLIEDQENAKFVSAASFWEIGIKISLGRLSLG